VRAVVQRVSQAHVEVEGKTVGQIGKGLLVFLGVEREDTTKDAEYLAEKIISLRIFEDQQEKMNLSLTDIGGSLLLVSQFTLCGDCRKGRRPSFTLAGPPETAKELYQYFADYARRLGVPVETGVFQAHMDVHLINDGPVTLLLDSKRNF